MTMMPFILGFLLGGVLIGLLVFLLLRGSSQRYRDEAASAIGAARAQADSERMRREFLEESRKELENSFKALATEALNASNRQFLELAETRLSRTQVQAQAELESRKQAIAALVEPLKESMLKLENRSSDIEKARVDAYAKVDQQISALLEQTIRLQEKTTSLSTALRGSQVRGRWGEIALKNIAELSGMTEHCDFFDQKVLSDGKRPDMVVRLPGKRFLAVDAKAPLTSYLAALEEVSEEKRNAALRQHVADIRGHMKTLSGRDYAQTIDGNVDLVVMFLPGDPFLAAAFTQDPELQIEALRAKVLIATPTTLIALLRTVAIYWQQQSVAENAEQIAITARTLYERAAVFADHLGSVGKGLRTAIDAYNRAVASFERRFIPMARQLEDLKVTEQTKQMLQEPDVIEETARAMTGDSTTPQEPESESTSEEQALF